MADSGCENCGFRKKYDQRPKSFLGRLWKFHARWCPGWKAYMYALPEAERIQLAQRYGLLKFKQPL